VFKGLVLLFFCMTGDVEAPNRQSARERESEKEKESGREGGREPERQRGRD